MHAGGCGPAVARSEGARGVGDGWVPGPLRADVRAAVAMKEDLGVRLPEEPLACRDAERGGAELWGGPGRG